MKALKVIIVLLVAIGLIYSFDHQQKNMLIVGGARVVPSFYRNEQGYEGMETKPIPRKHFPLPVKQVVSENLNRVYTPVNFEKSPKFPLRIKSKLPRISNYSESFEIQLDAERDLRKLKVQSTCFADQGHDSFLNMHFTLFTASNDHKWIMRNTWMASNDYIASNILMSRVKYLRFVVKIIPPIITPPLPGIYGVEVQNIQLFK